jgi:hypothetical protein
MQSRAIVAQCVEDLTPSKKKHDLPESSEKKRRFKKEELIRKASARFEPTIQRSLNTTLGSV